MNNQIRIDVIGATNTGKSTVIKIIKDALELYGLNSEIYSVDKGHNMSDLQFDQQIEAVYNKELTFKIHEVQSLRSSPDDL